MTIPGGGDRATGDPNVRALTAVASFGLAGSRVQWPPRLLGDEAWHSLLSGCTTHHLVGLLAAATAEGAITVDRRHRSGLDAVLTEWRVRTARLEHDAVELSIRLSAAGIDHRVVDGPVTARRGYARPGRRLCSSVDVLVADPTTVRDELDDLLSGRRLRLVTDLLVPRGRVGAELGDLPDVADVIWIAGWRVPSLPVDVQLVATCVAAHGDSPRPPLAILRDIAGLVLTGGATVDGVARWAERWRVTHKVGSAIRRTWATFDLADQVGLSAWALRQDHSADGGPQVQALAGLLASVGSFPRRWARSRTNIRTVRR